jgi:DNA-binding response OmpR family regulator
MRAVAHVAVAEDDPDMRGLVAEALRRDGYVVDDFADGGGLSSEVSEPSNGPIDLIVSDIHMPGVTGLAVLRALRESSSTFNLPVVLMTAFGDEPLRREATRLGAVLFNKPFELAELRRVVRSLLEKRASRSSDGQSDAKLGA